MTMLATASDNTAGDDHTLSFVIQRRGAAAYVTIRGERDVASAPRLLEMMEHVERGDPSCIVLDLSRVSFVDLHGLDTLDAIADPAAPGARAAVVVVRPGRCVTRLRVAVACSDRQRGRGRASSRPRSA
jgi:hypothetical protein